MIREFAKSEFGTLGVEYEVDVIDRATSLPLPIASKIALETQQRLGRGRVSPDLFASTLELTTGICDSITDVAVDLQSITTQLAPTLDAHNASLLGMGLHPFARAADAVVADGPRYQDIMDRITWPARRVLTSAIQIHVGMPSADHALATARLLRSSLPILLALSASSPFRNGEITGLASTRMALFASVPRSGPMPEFETWEAYTNYCDAMTTSDAMPTDLHTWWDCRLQPTLGTLEIRIAESIADFDDILAIVALAWCMAVGVRKLDSFSLLPTLNDENRWRAIRFGASSHMLTDAHGTTEPLSTVVDQLLMALDSTAESLGCRRHIERCINMSQGMATHQRLAIPTSSLTNSEFDLAVEASRLMRVNW
jgi:carboxylate-amine ligase